MTDLDAELALFEQEITSLEAAFSTLTKGNFQLPVIQSKLTAATAVKIQKPKKAMKHMVTISQPPIFHLLEASTLSSSPKPPQTLHPLQKDIDYLIKKQLKLKAEKTSYIGQVLCGKKKMKRFLRTVGRQIWEDPSLIEWDPDDYRIFCGNLGNDVNDMTLARAFQKYPSFQKAKVICDRRTHKCKGYGFVSLRDQKDYVQACREVNGTYVENRPIKLKKSTHKDRDFYAVRKKNNVMEKYGLI